VSPLAVVIADTHILRKARALDEDGLMLLNPGSPTDRRHQLRHTFALLRVQEGEVRPEILPL
jgi:predicted phosphodiesterase